MFLMATRGLTTIISSNGGELDFEITTQYVALFLAKTEGNDDFADIVDFLNASSIRYSLTVNPTVYVSNIKQFWSTAKTKTTNNETQIYAKVAGKSVVVTESSVRSDLQFNDEDGATCLTNVEIFENLALMGYERDSDKLSFEKALFSPHWKYLIHTILHCLSSKSTAWNEFSTNVASAVICLAKGQKNKAMTAQAKEIAILKKRVKKFEKRKRSRTQGFKILFKNGFAATIVQLSENIKGKINCFEDVDESHQGSWTSAQLKKLFDEEIMAKYERLVRSIANFVPMGAEERVKRLGPELTNHEVRETETMLEEEVGSITWLNERKLGQSNATEDMKNSSDDRRWAAKKASALVFYGPSTQGLLDAYGYNTIEEYLSWNYFPSTDNESTDMETIDKRNTDKDCIVDSNSAMSKGKYVPVCKKNKPNVYSHVQVTGSVLGLPNVTTWDEIEKKMGARKSKTCADKAKGKRKVSCGS
ncbi:hypothetical protein Tco_0719388 [Tanacetum coccineum]